MKNRTKTTIKCACGGKCDGPCRAEHLKRESKTKGKVRLDARCPNAIGYD